MWDRGLVSQIGRERAFRLGGRAKKEDPVTWNGDVLARRAQGLSPRTGWGSVPERRAAPAESLGMSAQAKLEEEWVYKGWIPGLRARLIGPVTVAICGRLPCGRDRGAVRGGGLS